MNLGALLAVGGDAELGAWSRWGLGVALNPPFPTIPLGTLAANLFGGYPIRSLVMTALGITTFVVLAK